MNLSHLNPLSHPFALAVSGYSGSGKTTLIEKCLAQLSRKFDLGYLKHDAHRFSMDHEGKDTYRAKQAGAKVISINSPEAFNLWQENHDSLPFYSHLSFQTTDLVLVEGYKNSSLNKILVCDDEGKAFDEFQKGKWQNVVALVYSTNPPSIANTSLPIFQRDQILEIVNWIQLFFESNTAPLTGLVLMGGKSTRMGVDKLQLTYTELPQYLQCQKIIRTFCTDYYFSMRESQNIPPDISPNQIITDKFLDMGPLGGILSAFKTNPQHAYLVIAVDLPLLQFETLEFLIKNRNPYKAATVFLNPNNQYIEPLCAIYEPKFFTLGLAGLARGIKCPRKILGSLPIQILNPPFPNQLENANRPEDYQQLKNQLNLKTRL